MSEVRRDDFRKVLRILYTITANPGIKKHIGEVPVMQVTKLLTEYKKKKKAKCAKKTAKK